MRQENSERNLEGPLDELNAKAALSNVHVGLEWIFQRQAERSGGLPKMFPSILGPLGKVTPIVANGYARGYVVEIDAVQLEELQKERAQVEDGICLLYTSPSPRD